MPETDNNSLLVDTTNNLQTHNNQSYDAVDFQNREQPVNKWKTVPQYIAAITANLSTLVAGIILGWTSPIMNELQEGKLNNITINHEQMGWVGSSVTLGAMLMCIPAGYLCTLLGTRRTLTLLSLPIVGGWVCIAFAKCVHLLYLGRFLGGLGVGGICVAAPLFVSEIAEKNIRGALGSYFQLMIVTGILFAYISGNSFSFNTYLIICYYAILLFVIIFPMQYDTPHYYLQRNKFDKALLSMKKYRANDAHCQMEVSDIETSLRETAQMTISFKQTLKKKSIIKALIIIFGLMFFQQLCGINAVILYSSDIFKSSGIHLDSNICAIVVGVAQVLATFGASLSIEKLGRRYLLLSSTFIVSVSMLCLAAFFTLNVRMDFDLSKVGFVPILMLSFFIIFYSIGLGPIPWMISSELLPPEVKNIFASCAGTFNWFLAFLVTKYYLQLNDLFGNDTTFYIFSGISLIGFLFTFYFVPETKGKTVVEVQNELEA